MKEMLARHKGKLILSSLVILLPILPAAFAGQTLFLWEPVLLLVSQWVIMLVVLHANRNKEQSPKVLNLVAWILPVLSLLLGVVGQLAQGGADSAYLITALFTFFIYNWTFGRKPLEQVHAEMALNSLKELGYDASMVKKLDKEELEGYDATRESGVPAGMCEAVKA